MSSPRKFRVWDGEEMHSPEALFVLDSRGNVWPYGVEHGSPTRDDLVPLFYTGLTDAEGMGIYESDLVKYSDEVANKVGRVVYDESSGMYRVISKSVDDPLYRSCGGATVIGNCHENPELLEQDLA